MFYESLPFAVRVATDAITIWFAFWAIRRKYELDYQQDRTSRVIRWFVVVLGFCITQFPGPRLGIVRILSGILFIGFLAWPNFAYHMTRILRGWKLLAGGPDA